MSGGIVLGSVPALDYWAQSEQSSEGANGENLYIEKFQTGSSLHWMMSKWVTSPQLSWVSWLPFLKCLCKYFASLSLVRFPNQTTPTPPLPISPLLYNVPLAPNNNVLR